MTAEGARRSTLGLPARWFAGWTLRARLLAALIALLALICLMIGGVTQLVARNYLVAQVDQRLLANAGYNVRHPPDPHGDGSLNVQGTPGAVGVAFYPGGQTDGRVMSQSGPSDASTTAAQNERLKAVPLDDKVHTITLPGLGSYHARAVLALWERGGSTPKIVVASPLTPVNDQLLRLGITEICLTIAGLIAAGLVGEAIIRRTLRPLNRVAAIATRVSEMELGRGEVALSVRVPQPDTDPRTEVGQVGSSINRMLGHVSDALAVRHASEVRVRKFVADASHELRTPLAAIRGYAELTRRVGGDGVSEDVAYAMRRVESESARMTTLVEDLLLLARLDAGRPLDAAPVDLSRLVVDAMSDAHVAGGDHEWSLDLPEDEVIISGDGPRLHQVLTNLLTNARVHTPAGTKVTMTLTPRFDGGAMIAVVDNGPGIPSSLLPGVFDRFARGDSSRSRAAGSTGLGLAIVAAVVESHGGTVEVTSHPGETAFTVTLPPTPPPTVDPAPTDAAPTDLAPTDPPS
jgi:two-component system OmpR family sensor kinase